MTDKRDPSAVLIAEINGSCKPHICAGINGNLPQPWIVHGMHARLTFREPSVAVFADASTADDLTVGVKLEIDAPFDHLELASQLADALSDKIRKLSAKPTAGQIRFMLEPGAIAPKRGTPGSSGYDLYAPTDILIRAGQVVVIHSGVRIELPDDTWEGQVRGRSGMSRRGLMVALGTVDSDYRGVIGATVANTGNEDAKVSKGDRYAQLVLARVAHPEWLLVEELTPSERGTGGFGSTGT